MQGLEFQQQQDYEEELDRRGLIKDESTLSKVSLWTVYLCPFIYLLLVLIMSICIVSVTGLSSYTSITGAINSLKNFYANEGQQPVQNFALVSNSTGKAVCPTGYVKGSPYLFPGVESGCLCEDGSLHSSAYCLVASSSTNCKKVTSHKTAALYDWNNYLLCVLSYQKDEIVVLPSSGSCSSNYTKCDTGYCVWKTSVCPITKITSAQTTTSTTTSSGTTSASTDNTGTTTGTTTAASGSSDTTSGTTAASGSSDTTSGTTAASGSSDTTSGTAASGSSGTTAASGSSDTSGTTTGGSNGLAAVKFADSTSSSGTAADTTSSTTPATDTSSTAASGTGSDTSSTAASGTGSDTSSTAAPDTTAAAGTTAAATTTATTPSTDSFADSTYTYTMTRTGTTNPVIGLEATITNPSCLNTKKYPATADKLYYPYWGTPLKGCDEFGDSADWTQDINTETQKSYFTDNSLYTYLSALPFWSSYMTDKDVFQLRAVRKMEATNTASCTTLRTNLKTITNSANDTIESIINYSIANVIIAAIGLLLCLAYYCCKNLKVGKRLICQHSIVPFLLLLICFTVMILCFIMAGVYWGNENAIDNDNDDLTYVNNAITQKCFPETGLQKALAYLKTYLALSGSWVFGVVVFLFAWSIIWAVVFIIFYFIRKFSLGDHVFRRP